MIITIEKRNFSIKDTGYIFKVNDKKYFITAKIFEMLQQQYYNTPRNERYEEVNEVTGMKYTYNLHDAGWAKINPSFVAFKTYIRKLKEEGFTPEQIKSKVSVFKG